MRTASGHKTAGPTATGGAAAQHDGVLPFVGKEAQVQKAGMTFPQDLSERAWEKIGANLRELTNSSAWWLADWLIFGEVTYGWRRYREAIERTGLEYQTLRNYAWVARRFEQHRRRDALTFAHHAEVTPLSPPEQDYWLRKAEQQKWSRNELRRAVRASLAEQSGGAALPPADGGKHPPAGPAAPQGTEQGPPQAITLTIELSAGQLDAYSKVAAAQGLPVATWATQVLDAADRRSA